MKAPEDFVSFGTTDCVFHPPSGRRPTLILVVDDHADCRYVMRRMLRLEGYDAVEAASGREALRELQTVTPSLIILDFNMPDLNGLDVLAEVRKDARLQEIPVLMFSASGGDVKSRALQAGVDAYVTKGTLDWAELHREIVRLIGPGRG